MFNCRLISAAISAAFLGCSQHHQTAQDNLFLHLIYFHRHLKVKYKFAYYNLDMKKKILPVIFVLMHVSVLHSIAQTIQPLHLTVEYMENPLGIDIAKPRFSWHLTSSERNQSQQAYEIIVSDDKKLIDEGKGNVWQSGKVTSDENVQVEYGGSLLASFTKYYWRVKVYDKTGTVSNWSTIAHFETAVLNEQDWKAKWID